jgi:hypothetical protein
MRSNKTACWSNPVLDWSSILPHLHHEHKKKPCIKWDLLPLDAPDLTLRNYRPIAIPRDLISPNVVKSAWASR